MAFFNSFSYALFCLFIFIGNQSYSQTTVIFNTPGAGTWTVPCGVTSVTVSVYGGGGGGGGSSQAGRAGGGGGSGGFCEHSFPVVPGAVIPFTVGTGGAGGAVVAAGAFGSQSNWDGGIIFALGGTGGQPSSGGGTGGAGGGVPGWTTISSVGNTGGNGQIGPWNANSWGGDGGDNPGGGTGGPGSPRGNDGGIGGQYGAGGGGGGSRWGGFGTTGGDGSDGAIILTFTSTITQPDAGADNSECVPPFILAGNSPDVGWTASWSVISGPASVTTPTDPNSAVTGLAAGDCSIIRWSFSQVGCPTVFDDVEVCYSSVCNDNCANALPMIVDGPCINGDNTLATVDPGVNPSCFSGTDHSNSLWYSFVATTDSITIVATAGTLTQFSMAVYSDCPAVTEFDCTDDEAMFELTGLTVGNTYYVLLDGNGSNVGDFCISAFPTLPPIGNGDRPRVLYIDNDCTKSSSCSGTNQNNYLQGNNQDVGVPWVTTSPGDWACPSNDFGQDAYWVQFNSEANATVTFTNYGGPGNGLDYTLFTGTYGSLTEISCNSTASGGSSVVPTVPNTDYMVCITPQFNNTPPRAYLCITAGDTYAPPNDDCGSATPILSGLNYVITNSNATVDLNNTLCAGTTENNVWVYWTADFTGPAFVNLQNQDCIEGNGMQMSIYQADASCPTAASTCELYISPGDDENFFGQFNAVSGQTYYMQMDGYCGTGCSFDFCITQTGGANCSSLAALPVELTSFTADLVNDNDVILNWRTESEINNDYFLIERSIDGSNWEEISTVDGNGTTQETQFYSEYDYDLRVSGVYYYRLTQYDYDGKFKVYLPASLLFKSEFDNKEIVRIVNIMGQDVDESYSGVKIYVYSDGSSEKKMTINN